MILVDTSVWIDHFHRADHRLVTLLEGDEVGSHPLIVEELALGSIRQRDEVLGLLDALQQFPRLAHHELMALVDHHRLWGSGLSAVDAHLMGATALVPGAQLWSRDKRLLTACAEAHIATVTER